MLREVFVFALILIGAAYSAFGAFYALLFYLWNAYFRPEVWAWNPTIAALNLSFVIGTYVAARSLISTPIRLTIQTGALLLFFFDTLLSALSSEHADASWTSWIAFSKVILISYLIVALVSDRKRLRLTLLVMALSLGFECVKQGWVELILNPGAPNNNTIPFLGDNNGVALGTMMLAPLFHTLAKTSTRTWEANVHRFCLVGVVMRGITTYSRGGFLAAGVLGLMALMQSRQKFRALAAVTILATLVAVAMPPRFWQRMGTIAASDENRDDSQRGRLHFWEVASVMADAKPLTGVGFDGYQKSYEQYNRSDDFVGPRAVHSVWFGVLADLGYPGFVLFVTILAMGVWSCWRARAVAARNPALAELTCCANGIGASLIAFIVGGTFLASQYSEMYWHLIGLSTAVYLIVQKEAAPVPAYAARWQRISKPVMAS